MVGTKAIVPPPARSAATRLVQRVRVTDDLHRPVGSDRG